MCIAEQMLICLEDETDKFETAADSNENINFVVGANYQL